MREKGFEGSNLDLVYGLPGQNVDNFRESIEKVIEIGPERLVTFSYAHVPWVKKAQSILERVGIPDAEEKLELMSMSYQMLTEVGYIPIGMDHYALPSDGLYRAMENGSLHRNFMGYTISRTQLMIGLGVSSISDSWYGFAQNVKNIEEYEDLVSNDIIPVYRGHLLSKEDQVVRRHILDLMCRLETPYDRGLSPQQMEEILARLAEPLADGLLQMEPERLLVTESGRVFIRNICMAFDLRLHNKAPETRLFSMTV
jgi:oxygen-independent coproporphyrinogen-3 oxidase